MLGGIVETSFGLYRAAAVEEGLSQLTIGAGQAFFVADHPVGVQRLREPPDGLIPLVLPGLFHGQVVVEDAEGAMVVERFEKIEGFQIVRTGLFGPVGADVQVAEIDESMGDGVGILLATLDRQHFFVAGVGLLQFAGQGIGVAEVAEAVREFTLGPGQAVVLDGRLPGDACLDEIATMEKNACAVFVVLSHVLEPSFVSRRSYLVFETLYASRLGSVAALGSVFAKLQHDVVFFIQAEAGAK